MFTGGLRDVCWFSLQYLLKRAQMNPILLKGRDCVCSLRGNPIVIIGFSPQSINITGFPHNIHNLSLWGVEGFSVILTALFHWYCRENLNPCKHLQCRIFTGSKSERSHVAILKVQVFNLENCWYVKIIDFVICKYPLLTWGILIHIGNHRAGNIIHFIIWLLRSGGWTRWEPIVSF